jgi:hypothetical protein
LSSEAGSGGAPAGVAGRRDAGHRPRLRSVVVWLLFHRFHVLLVLAFVGFPFLARGPAAPLLANLFVLGAGEQVTVAALATVAGQVLVIVTWTSTRAGPLRLWPGTADDPPERAIRLGYREFRQAFRRSWGTSRRWARRMPALAPWLAVALALPTLGTIWGAAWEGGVGRGRSLLALAAGVAVAQLLLAAASLATAYLTPAGAKHGLLEGSPWARRLAALARRSSPPGVGRLRERLAALLARPPFGPGYVWVDPEGRRSLHSGHLAAAGLLVATLAVYALLGVVNRPLGRADEGAASLLHLPALGALLLVWTTAAWILPALSFLLDRFRAPVLPAILLVSLFAYAAAGADHFFALRSPASPLPPAADADLAALDAWFAPGADGPPRPLVAVAAAGGGISAAAWTATALSGLASGEGGAEFLAALKLVSGVSGGAVGAMYFLDRLPPVPLASMPALNGATSAAIRDAAAASSLDAVGWGLAYPDLLRTVASLPFARLWPEIDRGWALEASWRRRLASPPGGATLAAWRRQALRGEKPHVVFGATSVETGARVELATLAVAATGTTRDFWSLYPGWDLDVATAARLSATFPFVSLAARARATHGAAAEGARAAATHLVDGGYVDNSGVVAALALLDRALERRCGEAERCDAPPVVLLRLRAFDETAPDARRAPGGQPWWTSVASPLSTLVAVRTSSQIDRNDDSLALFGAKWRARGVEFVSVDLDAGDAGPLSWKLTAAERERLGRVWEGLEAAATLRARLRGSWSATP